MDQILYFARTNFRNTNTPFGIKQSDRFFHIRIVGATGAGKTTLLETMLLQDIRAGRGLCLLDPHGDLVSRVYAHIPEHRKDNVIYLNITDPNHPFRYNPLKRVSYEKRALVASNIIDVFRKVWGQTKGWGVKMEHILRFTVLALLDQPKSTLADIRTMLYDKTFRRNALEYIVNEEVKAFWTKEFPRYMYNDILPVLNKIGSMLAYPAIRRIIIENKQDLSLRTIMDKRRILLVNLSKGELGEDVSQIVGSLLLTSLAGAAFSRVDTPEEQRVPFFIYLDEFQNFSTLSLVNMLSELRKYKVGMILAHQYMKQLEPDILDAVLGNAGTHISFRIGTDDAAIMARHMFPVFDIVDFVSLPNYHIYLTLMIDGKPSKPFSAVTAK